MIFYLIAPRLVFTQDEIKNLKTVQRFLKYETAYQMIQATKVYFIFIFP